MTDRLDSMRTLVAVSRSESLSDAACELGVSASAVSRQVARLEQDLATPLVIRSGQCLSLTAAGSRYAAFAQRILADISRQDAALEAIRDRTDGRISAMAPWSIDTGELGEAVAAFSGAHPSIEVRFEFGEPTQRGYDFIDRGFDVAFRSHAGRASALSSEKLADAEFVLCSSPGYIAQAGEPSRPRDLSKHTCLLHEGESVWRFEIDGATERVRIANSPLTSNSYSVLRAGALLGRGVAVLPRRLVRGDVRDGRLRVLLTNYRAPSRALFAVYPPYESPPARVRLFLDFLSDWFVDGPWLSQARKATTKSLTCGDCRSG